MVENYKISIPVLIPLVGALTSLFISRKAVKEFILLSTVTFTVISILIFLNPGLDGTVLKYDLITFYKGISFRFQVDWLGIFASLILSFSFVLVSIYTIIQLRYDNGEINSGFLFCFLLLEFGITGVVFSGSLLTLYFFFGVLSIVSWPFSAFHNTEMGLKNSRRYMGFLMIFFKGCFLPAIILVYINSGNIDFAMTNIQYGILKKADNYIYITIYLLFLAGVANTSILPVNNWLTGAISRNITVNIILYILIPVTGVYSIIRIFFSVFGYEIVKKASIDSVTIVIVLSSLVFSSIVSLYKKDLIKRFSYLFIGQFACILIGITMFSEYAVIGSVLQLIVFVLSAITLFMMIDIKNMEGFSPGKYFMSAFIINGFCFAGVPLFSGFLGKAYLIKATFENQQEFLIIFILAVIFISTLSAIQVYAERKPENKKSGPDKPVLIAFIYLSVIITYISAGLHNLIIGYIEKVVIP